MLCWAQMLFSPKCLIFSRLCLLLLRTTILPTASRLNWCLRFDEARNTSFYFRHGEGENVGNKKPLKWN